MLKLTILFDLESEKLKVAFPPTNDGGLSTESPSGTFEKNKRINKSIMFPKVKLGSQRQKNKLLQNN